MEKGFLAGLVVGNMKDNLRKIKSMERVLWNGLLEKSMKENFKMDYNMAKENFLQKMERFWHMEFGKMEKLLNNLNMKDIFCDLLQYVSIKQN